MPTPLSRAAEVIDAAQKIDTLADAGRTVAGLRTRARNATARAAKVGPVRRFFLVWHANRLDEKADRLASERGLPLAPPVCAEGSQ